MNTVGTEAIRFDSVGKRFEAQGGPVLALDEIDLSVVTGQFVSVVGPSGCGKTTLMRMIAGLITPSSGEIFVNGSAVTGPHSAAGVVFQRPVLLPWRTTLENVLLPLDVRKKPTAEDRAKAMAVLELVGLAGFEKMYPNELSGGMQQRVAISRALIHDPKILLLDEPFGALDAMTRENLNLELNRLWHSTGKTAVLITHSIPEAVFLGQKVVVMGSRPGRVLEIFDIDLPEKRDLELLGTPEFAAYTAKVRECMSGLGEGKRGHHSVIE